MKKYTTEELNKLSEMSGENNVKSSPKYNLAVIRIQGKEGHFTKMYYDADGKWQEEKIGDSFEGVILKIRRTMGAITNNGDDIYFSTEHNSNVDTATLFYQDRTKKEPKTQMLDTGTYKELKTKFPNLKMKQILYFLLAGEVVKVEVKGKGLSKLFDYYSEFSGSEHLFQFITKVGMTSEKSPLGDYFAMSFEKGKNSDLDEVAPKIEEVNSKIEEIETFYANRKPQEEFSGESAKLTIDEDIPVMSDVKDEDIPVISKEDEIPF